MKANINDEQAKERIEMFKRHFIKKTKVIIQEHSLLLIDHLRKKHMTGGTTTDTRIRRRSGQLADSMRPVVPVKETTRGLEGGVSFGKVYARVHIGPRGQMTKIKPKAKKFLTIPLAPMLTKAGVLRATAAELMQDESGMPFGNAFIRRSNAGNLIIFGTQRITKGAKSGKHRGDIIPLFILKKNVKIKARVHPEDFLKWSKDELVKDLKKKGIEGSITYG